MGFIADKMKKVLGFEEEDFELEKLESEENYEDLYKAISNAKRIKEDKSISLNDKVNNITRWYKDEYLKEKDDFVRYYSPFKLRDFIEKVAVWYELRYPNHDVLELGVKRKSNLSDTNRILLEDNEYVDLFFSGLDMKDFEWSKFYNTHAFVRGLDEDEKKFFEKPRYPKTICWNNATIDEMPFPMYLDGERIDTRETSYKSELSLSKNGKVIDSKNMRLICNNISDRKLIGMHIVDVINLLHENGIRISSNNSFVKAVQQYELEKEMREKLFDAIMYRIIERGGERVGPKRGLIFAKEFGRDIDVPMKYGMDLSDPYLEDFINEYLKSGGNKNLECLLNYFICKGDYSRIKRRTVSEMLSSSRRYTEEEKELAQKLVDLLASQVDYDVIRKEDAKKLRLEKQLRKSKIKK